jgi:Arc/MetJ family transcription regulator
VRTTLDIDADLLATAMGATGARTTTEAIEAGLRELVRRAARSRALDAFPADFEAPARRDSAGD